MSLLCISAEVSSSITRPMVSQGTSESIGDVNDEAGVVIVEEPQPSQQSSEQPVSTATSGSRPGGQCICNCTFLRFCLSAC